LANEEAQNVTTPVTDLSPRTLSKEAFIDAYPMQRAARERLYMPMPDALDPLYAPPPVVIRGA
jgi:hypothetical protein